MTHTSNAWTAGCGEFNILFSLPSSDVSCSGRQGFREFNILFNLPSSDVSCSGRQSLREYLGWVRDKDPNARLGVLDIWVIPEFINASIEKAVALKTDSNNVFLDIDILTVNFPEGIRMCREAEIPLEVYSFEEDDEDAIKALDPYVSGLTSNQIRFEDIR